MAGKSKTSGAGKGKPFKPGAHDITTSSGKSKVASEAASAGAKLAKGGKGGSRPKKNPF